jgi:predicted glycosyltransferase
MAIRTLAKEIGPHRVVAVTGPLFDLPSFMAAHPDVVKGQDLTLVTSDPRLPDLLAASRFAICGGGYNTLAEAIDVGLPVVSIPGLRPSDDGHARARALAEAGHPVLLADPTTDSIVDRLVTILATPRRDFVPGPSTFGGAREAAAVILDILNTLPTTR